MRTLVAWSHKFTGHNSLLCLTGWLAGWLLSFAINFHCIENINGTIYENSKISISIVQMFMFVSTFLSFFGRECVCVRFCAVPFCIYMFQCIRIKMMDNNSKQICVRVCVSIGMSKLKIFGFDRLCLHCFSPQIAGDDGAVAVVVNVVVIRRLTADAVVIAT